MSWKKIETRVTNSSLSQMLVESPNLIEARRRNRFEDQVSDGKVSKITGDYNRKLIKLYQNIYKVSMDLEDMSYELKRNKLETIYSDFSSQKTSNESDAIYKSNSINGKNDKNGFENFKDSKISKTKLKFQTFTMGHSHPLFRFCESLLV